MTLRLTLFLTFSFLQINTFCQDKKLLKAWSGENLEYIKIDSQYVYFEVEDNFEHEKRYRIIGDTLRMYQTYTTSRDNFSKEHIDNYDFLLKKLTKNELVLTPLDSNAKRISKNKEELRFIDRATVIDKNFKFEKIIYKVYGGGWGWTDIAVTIDNQMNVSYINKSNRYINKKLDHFECFSGKLSESLFKELIKILKSSEIEKLKNFNQIVYDIPETTIDIHYNQKFKRIKQFIMPSITKELILFLTDLPKRTADFKIEPCKIKFEKER